MKSIILTFLIIFFVLISVAQDVPFTKASFPEKKKELCAAKKQLKKGKKLASKGIQYHSEALQHLMAADTFNPNSAKLNYQIGSLLSSGFDAHNALPYLEKAIILDSAVTPDILFLLGSAYHLNHRFGEAIRCYTSFTSTLTKRSAKRWKGELQRLKTQAMTGDSLMNQPVHCFIDNLGDRINSQFPEYSPVLSRDGTKLWFASRRPGSYIEADQLPSEDIWYLAKLGSTWSEPVNAGPQLNSEKHEIPVALSPDGNVFYFRYAKSTGDIWLMNLTEGKKAKRKEMSGRTNSPANETCMCFSPDGNTVWFVSDRKGGYGGKDIWMMKKGQRGKWAKPVNAGPVVNTRLDEESPFMHSDGKTLYFSSMGHDAIGGFDIFSVRYTDEGYTECRNLGFPVNSASDDIHFSLSGKGSVGFMASCRPGGLGNFDLYKVTFSGEEKSLLYLTESVEPPPSAPGIRDIGPVEASDPGAPMVLMKGKVWDETGSVPLNALLTVTDLTTGRLVAAFQSDSLTGQYLLNLPVESNLALSVISYGYLPFSNRPAVGAALPFTGMEKDFFLKPITPYRHFDLVNLGFSKDDPVWSSPSERELEMLVDFLQMHPLVKTAIEGYLMPDETDTGLPQARAQAVITYLRKQGIEADRAILYQQEDKVDEQDPVEKIPLQAVRIHVVASG